MQMESKRKAISSLLVLSCFLFLLFCLRFQLLRISSSNFLSVLSVDSSAVTGVDLEGLAASNEFTVEEVRGLGQVLHKASLGDRDKTVILTHLNQAWAANGSMIDLFLGGFRNGIGTKELLDHLVIVALDEPSLQRCVQIHKHCFVLKTDGVDFAGDQKLYMAEDYLKMMWRRIQLLTVILELGYSFVFTDTDVLWMRTPFPRLHPGADFEIACDGFNGDDTDMGNPVNGGFLHVVSSIRTISLYKLWYQSRLKFPGQHDQQVFNEIKFTPELQALNLTIRLLGTEFIGGFCDMGRIRNRLEDVCTMHATCCIGLEKKLSNLQLVAEDWELFKLMSPDQRHSFPISWRAPRGC